jgi:hypothetical protein
MIERFSLVDENHMELTVTYDDATSAAAHCER